MINLTLTALLAGAMYTDLRSSRIPNWLTLPAAAGAPVFHMWLSGFEGLVFSLLGLSVGLGLFLLLYISGCIGAGDVKLMAAVGAMIGPSGALASGVLAILVGGLYALGAMAWQWGWMMAGHKLAVSLKTAWLTGGKAWTLELTLPFRLRYGFAIAGGTLLFQLGLHPFGG